ncbi:MAG: hypothetical protein KBT03_04015, partial [Bacteroidales bacterium]|nr:hypothetical protein [Candidatus Scybalousia scybalohippi]
MSYEIELCKNKKFMQSNYRSYLKSDDENIFQAYGKPSQEKIKAYSYCEQICKEYDGKNIKVVGASTYIFTVGFEITYNDEQCFVYITPQHNWYIPL